MIRNRGTSASNGLKHSVGFRVTSTVIPEEETKRLFAGLRVIASPKLGPRTNEIPSGGRKFFTELLDQVESKEDLEALNNQHKLVYVFVLLRYGDSHGKWETAYCAYYVAPNAEVAHFCGENNYEGHPLVRLSKQSFVPSQ
jgi:hypothetical protein